MVSTERPLARTRGQFGSLSKVGSRRSFPATEPPGFRRVSEGVQKGSLKGSLKAFRRVIEGF